MLAHNGEINTLHGQRQLDEEPRDPPGRTRFGAYIEDVKPIIQAGGSDTAALDNVFELLVRAGRDAPMAKTMLIPEASATNATMPAEPPRPVHLLQRGDGAVGRPGRDRRRPTAAGWSPASTATACARCATPSPPTAC